MQSIARQLPFVLAIFLLCTPAYCRQSWWAHYGSNGRLVYAHLSNGDRIPDFSSAGYRGGGIALPFVPQRLKVSPEGRTDDTPAIQAALDAVAKLAPGADGIRGAVELASGTFHLAGTLKIIASGVVLRGAGASGRNATVLDLIGAPHLAIDIEGEFHVQTLAPATMLTDAYVPAGTIVVHVADASGIHSGDTLRMIKPVTPLWIHFMGMDHLSREGEPEVWLKNDISVFRRVAAVSRNTVTLEVPLTDSFDSRFYPGSLPPVTRVERNGRIAEVGVEDLRVTAPNRSINYGKDTEFDGIQINNAVDSWLRSLAFENTTNSVRIDRGVERMTVTSVDVVQQDAVTSRAKPFDFSLSGAQILLDRCSGKGDKVFYVATQSRSEGPIVVLHCRFSGNGAIEPHQRWSTGLLVDECEVPGGSINLRNRGEMGSGHGWTIGWSVLWNNSAANILVQNPPGAVNWSIGDRGEQSRAPMPVFGESEGFPLPGGIVESPGQPVEPASLYLEQLRERLGSGAVAAIGYR